MVDAGLSGTVCDIDSCVPWSFTLISYWDTDIGYCPINCVTTNVVIRLVEVDPVTIRGCYYHAYDHRRSAVMQSSSLHIHVVETVLLQPVTSYNIITRMDAHVHKHSNTAL